jgi:peptidoglycan/xylan/chitin deacetylase (PgdA/CDA1 family)
MAGRRPHLLPPVAAATATWCAPALASIFPPAAAPLRIRTRAPRGSRAVHVTFDDGPHPQATPAVLEILARFGAHATFFLVAEQVERFPALAAEVAAAGHVVAVHGYRHRCQLRLGPRTLADDLRRAADVIGGTVAPPAPIHRPPYGVFTPVGLAVTRRLGLEPWLWSRWGRDWRADATPDSVTSMTARGLRDGDVVLLHDADHYADPGSWRSTVGALPRILGRAEAAGLRAVALP